MNRKSRIQTILVAVAVLEKVAAGGKLNVVLGAKPGRAGREPALIA